MPNVQAVLREIERGLSFLPDFVVAIIFLAIVALLAAMLHSLLYRAATRFVAGRDLFWRSLVSRTHGPTRLALIIFALGAAVPLAPLTTREADGVQHGLLVAFILLLGWVALTAMRIWTTVYLRRFKLDSEDNLLARKHVTQSRILQRVAETLVVMITIASALMTLEGVRQYGVSLLASAGAAGLVAGFALQPVLKNLVAGIQLAITQPIRIDDALLVEGEWGNVEEISATYVVVRIWDWRRLVLPLSYFIEQPFQNWTREGAALIGNVMLYTDYTVPVAAMRNKLTEILKQSPNWDGEVAALQVTDFREHTMEIRMLMSASNAGRAFDLRCEVREKMIAWLQEVHPDGLPRYRTELGAAANPAEIRLQRAG